MSQKLFYGIAGCLLFMFCAINVQAETSSNIIEKIIIVGNDLVDEDVIRDTIRSKEGEYYSETIAANDTQALSELGDFSAVDTQKILSEGKIILTFRVVEQFNVFEIEFSGQKIVKEKKLYSLINTELDRPVNFGTLINDLARIRDYYAKKGYAKTKIDYTVESMGNSQNARIVIHIDEGAPSYIREIVFVGNDHISSTKLKMSINTRARILFLFGKFDQAAIEDDLWTITEMYQTIGYVSAKVDYQVKPATTKKEGLLLEININEGPIYRVDGITIKQTKLHGFYATNLFYEVAIFKGGVFSPQAVEKDTENIRNYYRSLGYADAFVNAKALESANTTSSNMLIDVYFDISENGISDIGLVEIKGNTRTKDLVIRRELNILPGDRYNYYRIETSRQKLQNMNYFSAVDIIESDSKSVPNSRDIQINVKEKLTGQIGFGVGYSSENLVFGTVTISQPNFDIFNWRNFFVGGGQKFMIKSEFGYNRQDIVVSFTEPYFLYEKLHGRKVAFGFDFFARNNNAVGPDIQIRRIGGDVRLGTPVNFGWVPKAGKYIGTIRADLTVIGEYVNVDTDHSLDYDDFVLGDDSSWVTRRRVNKKNGRVNKLKYPVAYADYDKYLKDEDGSYVQMSPEITFTRDTRDKLILPTRGAKTTFKTKLSMGSAMYGLLEAKHSHYFKLFDLYKRKPKKLFSGSHVLLVRGSLGFATDDTPIFDRFFIGGSEEMRGFKYGMAGPKDYSGDNPLGGTSKLFGSTEYIFPVYKHNENISMHASVWFDIGNVWWKDRKYTTATPHGNSYYIEEVTRSNAGEINGSVGASLIMQMWRVPLRLNYGYPIITDSESRDVDPFDGLSFGTGFSF